MLDQAEIHKKCSSEYIEDRREAVYALGSVFSSVPDKSQAWQDFIKLTQDEDSNVRWRAAEALGNAFSQVPDKIQAWQDLIRLTHDRDRNVSQRARDSLKNSSPVTVQCMRRLIQEGYGHYKWIVSVALINAFSLTPDKVRAGQDLHRLAQDKNFFVRGSVADALVYVFSQVPDKNQAWQDLHRFAHDTERIVRGSAAEALGNAFSQVPDKNQALQDLMDLKNDEDGYVKTCAYYSLGRASVFNAIADKFNLKNHLEDAIDYFEKSLQEESFLNPAGFCYPFYRTYLAITFQETKEDEVQRYIADARKAVGGSESKDELLKAVENLANALKELQRLKQRPLQEIADELNSYRWYCERAAEYMAAAEDKAPGAVKLMRICNHIIDDKIKNTIAGIQRKAGLISPEIEQAAKCLLVDNPIEIHKSCMRMATILRNPSKKLAYDALIDIEKEPSLSVVVKKIELAMAYTLPSVEAESKEILDRLGEIQQIISNFNLSSDSAKLRTTIKNVQDKIAAQGLNMEDLNTVLKDRDYAMIEKLEKMRDDWLISVENMAQNLFNCDEHKILKEIQGLKQSKRRDILGITGDLSSIVGMLVGLAGLA